MWNDRTVRAVAFDLGGVLVDVDHGRAAAALGVSVQRYQDALFSGDEHDRMSRGLIAPQVFIEAGARALACHPEAVARAWASVVRVLSGADLVIASVAAQRRRVLIWSNTDPIHAAEMGKTLPVVLGAGGVSFRVGAMKPERSFYERALDPDLAPGDVLFLDDRADNVAAAAAFGVQAHLVSRGLAQVHEILAESGIRMNRAGERKMRSA